MHYHGRWQMLPFIPGVLLLFSTVTSSLVLPACCMDADGDGYSTCATDSHPADCDDNNASIYPGAVESCNGIDDDCDAQIDNNAGTLYLIDQDGDGFGALSARCSKPATAVGCAGDCDDSSSLIYPGAPDATDDGLDQDCGGTQAADPSLGLAASQFSSIQSALDAAPVNAILWVGPGTYEAYNLSFHGKAVTLISTCGSSSTTLDAHGKGRVMTFNSLEGPSSRVNGFSLVGGVGDQGAGVYCEASSPTFTGCRIAGNTASLSMLSGLGGGAYLKDSSAAFIDCAFSNNRAGTSGGGLYMTGSKPTLSGCRFTGNSAGGQEYFSTGGGLHARGSTLAIDNCLFTDNVATGESAGGGLYLEQTSGAMSHCLISGNSATFEGGGIRVTSSSPSLTSCLITGNRTSEVGVGTAMALYDSSPVLSGCVVTGNLTPSFAYTPSALYVQGSSSQPVIEGSVVAFNSGFQLYVAAGTPELSWSDWYAPGGTISNLPGLEDSNLELEPGFLTYDGGGLPTDYHLAVGSPLIDAGQAGTYDVDGGKADLGVYGGPAGGSWDLDGDGFPAYFWPGTFADMPAGTAGQSYDADDADPAVH